jgi:amino acid transporter
VQEPEKNYPKALAISSITILFTLVLASLAIAVIIPSKDLHVVIGPVQAFKVFFQSIGMLWLLPITAILIIIGAVSCVATWIIGPTKGLLIAAEDGNLPNWMTKTNKCGVPIAILFCQGIIVTGLSLIYLLMPTAEGAYMVLTELTAILALLMYVMMFVSAIALRYKFPRIHRPYKIPLGNIGMLVVAGMGSITSFLAMLLGFIPPSQINIGKPWIYQVILIVGTFIFCLPAFFIGRKKAK